MQIKADLYLSIFIVPKVHNTNMGLHKIIKIQYCLQEIILNTDLLIKLN